MSYFMINLDRLKFWKKQPIIEFFCHPDFEDVIPKPAVAGKNIPSWFKKLPMEYEVSETDQMGVNIRSDKLTAKACLPLLDAMTLGYTIPLCGDITVNTNDDCSQINVKNPKLFSVAEFHDSQQVGGNSGIKNNNGSPIKFVNRWVIKTAPGWSTLFLPPINSYDNPHFTCLSGLVDTDKYPKEINFPAIWHTPNFKGVVRAGTPLVTAIPIKRSTIINELNIRKITNDEIEFIEKMRRIQLSRDHYYTKELRVKK